MFFVKKQGQPLTPEEKMVLNKTLMLSGTVSPLELSSLPAPTPAPVPSPMQPSTLQANPAMAGRSVAK
jgi:hypothetical protein